jgi:hypothetical protein
MPNIAAHGKASCTISEAAEIDMRVQSGAHKRYTLAIYALFGVGWVFGLGGRLLGFDAPNGAE